MRHLMVLLLAVGVDSLALAVLAVSAPYSPKLGRQGPHWLYPGMAPVGCVAQDPNSTP